MYLNTVSILSLSVLLFSAALAASLQHNETAAVPSLEFPTPNSKPVTPKYERIVTDFEEILTGVPLSNSYNDTSSFPTGEGLASAPGCPKNIDGYPWLLYQPHSLMSSLNRCYLAGERGPCELGQKIFVEAGTSSFGFCNCDCFEGVKRNGSREIFCSPFLNNLKNVFYPEAKKCYTLYDQGPCKEGEWLVEMDETQKQPSSSSSSSSSALTKCEKRQCPIGKLPQWTKDSQGNKLSLLLECVYPSNTLVTYAFADSMGGNRCGGNLRYSSLLRKCVRQRFSFTF